MIHHPAKAGVQHHIISILELDPRFREHDERDGLQVSQRGGVP